MTSEHKACKNPECHSAEFWILPDGRITCADSDCYAEYGRVAGPGAERIFSPVTGSGRKLDRDWARITPGIEGRLISVSVTDEAASAWIDVRPEHVPAAEEAGQLTLGDPAEAPAPLTGGDATPVDLTDLADWVVLLRERDELAGQIAAVRAIAEPWAAGRDSGDERIAVRAVTAAAILEQLRDGAGS